MLENFYFLLVIAYVSMFAHFLKKKVKGETSTEIRNYFKDSFKTTLLSIISVGIGLMIVKEIGQLNVVSSVGIGYSFDSIFNEFEDRKPLPDIK